jgi:hypothetical protein
LTSSVVYEKSHFVSLTGEAANSTIVPYLGYLEKFGEPLSVTLLSSPGVAQWSPGIARAIRELTPSVPLREMGISNGEASGGQTGGEKASAFKGVWEAYRELEDSLGNLAVNMMGGMKLTLLAGLFALKGRGHVFLQLSEELFVVSRLVGDSVRTETMAMKASLPLKKSLELQKIEYSFDPNPPWDLKRLCHEAHIPLPEGALFNVILGGNRVDCVWSAEGSLMSFLLVVPNRHLDGPEALANARHVETLASTKWWTNGLFSRRVFVLEGLSYNVDRYNYEVPGLVRSYRVDWRDSHLTESARESLLEIFSPHKGNPLPAFKRPKLDILQVPTLVTAMGRMSDATLLAIVSHKRPQVALIYTPEDEWVSHMAKVYQDKASELGLKRVILVPTDYTGANVHAHLPSELAPLSAVNVTPGTKPHGVALGLWALNHNIPAWAIDREVIRRLDQEGQAIPVKGLTIKAKLDFTLETQVTDYGWGRHSADWDGDDFYREMFRFMRLALGHGKAERFHRECLELEGYRFERLGPASLDWAFTWPSSPSGKGGHRKLAGGFWYEKLTAKAVDSLNSLGHARWDVSCGVEVSIPGNARYLTERDVLATNSRAQIFMISCKTSGKKKGHVLRAYLDEVEAMAKTLGRFVMPVLCDMTTVPPWISGDALVIGWTTLCRPKELSKALEMATKATHG